MVDIHAMNPEDKRDISVVIPVYGSIDTLPELHERIVVTLEKITRNFELILVNDASPGNAWEAIRALVKKDARVRGLNLSRNFGQYPALTAGLRASRGEWIVVMDCDLQDQPEEIVQMYAKAQEGYAVVVGSRQMRHDTFLRRLFSRLFYATLSYLTGRAQDRSVANFGIYHRRVIDAVLSLPERMRYFSVMVRWVGFKTATVPVIHSKRQGGKSGYSFTKLLKLAVDIFLAHTEGPLRLIVKVGVVVTLCSGLYLTLLIIKNFTAIPATPTQVLFGSLWLMFGLFTIMLGIIALYLGKTFDEVKGRPIYIIDEEV